MSDWRENWFVKNIIAEIPIFGSFAKQHTLSEAVNDAGTCVAALAGGSLAMEYAHHGNAIDPQNMLNNAVVMAVGMTAAKTVYNTGVSATLLFSRRINSCRNSNNSNVSNFNSNAQEVIGLMPTTYP